MSENKKRKAKNSYLVNGGTRIDGKMKRTLYYRKRDRCANRVMEMW